ncbi:MAG: hypothetical protein ACLT2T_12035 [Bilophila wadsworthia]
MIISTRESKATREKVIRLAYPRSAGVKNQRRRVRFSDSEEENSPVRRQRTGH